MDLNLVWAVLAGTALAAAADWLFAGLLFRRRYQLHPDTWRGGPLGPRVAATQVLALITAAAFVLLADKLGQIDLRGNLKLAAMIWLIGPLPLLAANAMFIRIDHVVTASHAAGWLVKLLLIGAVTAWFL